ncbi:hypothetical protein AAG570_007292 [Ranatra chinensis]|uniref:N-acetyltransferase ESCO acetyl-transferase domain-containing protein n=1 Tax=Ranatra chinensis TaxID=642074 RepID=A0ABD0XVF9_9HEMI
MASRRRNVFEKNTEQETTEKEYALIFPQPLKATLPGATREPGLFPLPLVDPPSRRPPGGGTAVWATSGSSGWKKERLAGVHGLERIVYITRDDPKTWWTKAKTVAAIVDADLGFPEVTLEAANNPKAPQTAIGVPDGVVVRICDYHAEGPGFDSLRDQSWLKARLASRPSGVFLYIKDKRICGCAIAEVVRQAHRLLDLPPVEGVTEVDVCSEEAYPVRCGISRLWVHPHHRRSGVATRLLDAIRITFMELLPPELSIMFFRQESNPEPMITSSSTLYTAELRQLRRGPDGVVVGVRDCYVEGPGFDSPSGQSWRNFCFGNILRLDDMAFSVPTEAGKRFAHRYTGRKDFLVYM